MCMEKDIDTMEDELTLLSKSTSFCITDFPLLVSTNESSTEISTNQDPRYWVYRELVLIDNNNYIHLLFVHGRQQKW